MTTPYFAFQLRSGDNFHINGNDAGPYYVRNVSRQWGSTTFTFDVIDDETGLPAKLDLRDRTLVTLESM
jgi:hypothetical protein